MPTRNPHDGIHEKPDVPIARSNNARLIARRLQREGLTLDGIAAELLWHGYGNRHGKPFHKSTVHFLIKGGRK